MKTSTPQEPSSRRKLSRDDGRLVRGRRSRERIRAAASELFRERGFDAATLRAIAERAGMGASSIYRHVESKEELLVQELADLQEEAWTRFRRGDDRMRAVEGRLTEFFVMQHELLARERDLTVIALRATTHPDARVARHVLALHDRTIGLIAEILQGGRQRGDLAADVDLLTAARALFHSASGARISWANGLLSEKACREAIAANVTLLFRGLSPRGSGVSAPDGPS
ncbi:MAG: helix-turn-helix transcriptional regulator [Deltaproteobacteria bacterium]|nr:helix-turn-helix transcriptional regulator [Deltaproteobacteria bacterium]